MYGWRLRLISKLRQEYESTYFSHLSPALLLLALPHTSSIIMYPLSSATVVFWASFFFSCALAQYFPPKPGNLTVLHSKVHKGVKLSYKEVSSMKNVYALRSYKSQFCCQLLVPLFYVIFFMLACGPSIIQIGNINPDFLISLEYAK